MRAQHLAAAGVAALALAAGSGASRADETRLAAASRPFSLGEVWIERMVETAVRVGRFECAGEDCFGVSGDVTVVALDVSAALPIADSAAVFVVQPILFRSNGNASSGGASEDSHQFPGAVTLGIRHVGTAGPALELATAVSVSLPMPGGGGEAGITTAAAGKMVDDSSLYTDGQGTLRLELDARRRWAPLFVQAQLAVAAHSNEDGLLASSRGGVGAGVQLLGWAALLVELTTRFGDAELACDSCIDGKEWRGPTRPALSVGGRVALGAWDLGARGFLPLTDPGGVEPRPSLSVTVGARF